MQYKQSKSLKRRRRSSVDSPSEQPRNPKLVRIVAGVLVVVGLFIAVRFVFGPVVRTAAAFWKESTTAISFILPGGEEIQKDDDGHTNVLLAGIDRRSYQPYQYSGADGEIVKNGFLADTIIIASLDESNNVVDMLSLPRDMWVKVPPFGALAEQHTKINAVHSLGDRFEYSDGGGMGLLERVVEDITGMDIHYWGRVDFEAFVQGVDAIGGINIYVENAFDDYAYPRAGYEDAAWEERYQHVHFDQGWQLMDGDTALQYARSRHSLGIEGSDFARAKRQQKVIEAFIQTVMSSETLLDLGKLQGLYGAVSENITTNVSLGELPLFYKIAKDKDQFAITGHVLVSEEVTPPLLYSPDPTLFSGAYVLIPVAGQDDYSEVQQWVRDMFYMGIPNADESSPDLRTE